MSYLDNFNFQILGKKNSARKLVFLHGLMSHSLSWKTIAARFCDEFEILLYDQRGHGRSFQPGSGYSPRDYAEDLAKILSALQWDRISLVGHSLGARCGLEFVQHQANRVEKLVLVDVGPTMPAAEGKLLTEMLTAIPVPFRSKSEAKQFFGSEFIARFGGASNVEKFAEIFFANLKEQAKENVSWRFSLSGVLESIAHATSEDRSEQLRQLRLPTLLLRGEFSRSLPRDVFTDLLAANSGIHGVEVSQSGHWLHLEKPEEFTSLVSEFLIN